MSAPRVGVCIPTLGRPRSVERVLRSIAEQQLTPAIVVVVDASADRETEEVCRQLSALFPNDRLRHVPSERGLPLQRRRGIEVLAAENVEYACMLDDDVTLAPDFLTLTIGFLGSAEGCDYGGVCGYSVRDWGAPFDRLDRLYARLGIYDGPLRAGRWLYCGRLLALARLSPFDGVHTSDYLPGGLTVWRMRVFEGFLPPLSLAGYALWEDVHLSLRVATRFKLGVLGRAHVWHDHAPGGRPKRVRMAFTSVRRQALLLRDCDPRPRMMRYVAFLSFLLIDLVLRTSVVVARARFRALPEVFGAFVGWVSCAFSPPGPTADALLAGAGSPVAGARVSGDDVAPPAHRSGSR